MEIYKLDNQLKSNIKQIKQIITSHRRSIRFRTAFACASAIGLFTPASCVQKPMSFRTRFDFSIFFLKEQITFQENRGSSQ